MNELTVKEIASSLGVPTETVKSRIKSYGDGQQTRSFCYVPTETVKSRIKRAKIKPVRYVSPTAIYAPGVVEAIRDVRMGCPPKPKLTT